MAKARGMLPPAVVCIVILVTANDSSERLPPHGALRAHPEGRRAQEQAPLEGLAAQRGAD